MIYTNSKIGRWCEDAGHPGHVWGIGKPYLVDEQGQPVLNEDAPEQFEVRGWDEAWGELPTEEQLAFEPEPVKEVSLTDVDVARQYAEANEAARQIVFLLMARTSMALVGLGLQMANGDTITADNVNAEGTRFVATLKNPLDIFRTAGRHPDAGDALYASVMSNESKALYPWLNNETVASIFATTIPRNA